MSIPSQLEIITRKPGTSESNTPLLFVHGAWHGAWCWEDHFLPYFADHGYAVHAVSLRGHGKSPIEGSLSWATIGQYVADVAQAAAQIEAQAATRPVVIGHSLGGWVVQKYIEKYPTPGAVLIAPIPAHGTLYASLRAFRADPMGFTRTILQRDLYPLVENFDKATMCLFSESLPPEQRRAYQARLQSEAFLGYLQTIPQWFRRAPKNPPPVLVLAAEQDHLFSPREQEQTARFYGGEYALIHGAAHDVMLERNWHMAADRMLAWLRERGL